MSTDADGKAPRRITRRGVARRDQIRSVATELFLEHGYEAVSIDDIIKAVGGSKTNLYNHFGGKEGLFTAVAEEMCEKFLDTFKTIDASGHDLATGLRLLGRDLLAILLEDRHVAFQRLIFAESGRFPSAGRAWFESGPESSRRVIAQFIQVKQEAGEMRPGDPHRLATFFHDMIVTDALYRALIGIRPERAVIERTIADAVALLATRHEPDADS